VPSARQFLVAHVQVQLAVRHVELDDVAVLHQRQRAAGRGLGRGVQHHGAVGGAAHARVADADHVGDALAQHLGRQRHVAGLGHAGVALGAAVLEHHHAVLVDVEALVVDAAVQVVGALEHHRAALVHQQFGRGRAGLDDRAVGREVAAQHADAGLVLEGLGLGADHLRVVVLGVLHVLPHAAASDGEDVLVQVVGDLLDHHRQAAGIAEVLHQELARRLQVQDAGQLGGQAVEVVERELDADAPGDRQQVDHEVGRAADRGVDLDRVLDRLARQDLRHVQVLVDHADDAPARLAREHVAAAVDGREGRVARQADAQRFDHAGHGARGAHRHAVAMAAVHAALGLEEVLQLERAGAHLLAHLPHAGARAELLAAPLARQHRAARHADGRQVDAGRAHHQRGCGLVAAHEQHHAIERIAADAFLHVHAREVAIEHGGGAQQGLAERHHGELEREAAGLVDTDLHLLRERAEVRVAGREFAEGVADADDRAAVELVVRHALALHPASVDEAVAVVSSEPLLAAQLFGILLLGRGAHRGCLRLREGAAGSGFVLPNRIFNHHMISALSWRGAQGFRASGARRAALAASHNQRLRMIKNVHGNTVDRLGSDIVAGRYAPGAAIPPEPILCEELGVSRTVVRESIKSLIAKGLVTTGPKVGTRVQPPDQWNWFDADVIVWQTQAGLSIEFLRDLQDLRRVVEPAAVALAASRATPADIADMEEAYAGMKQAIEFGGDYITPDLRFHQGLIRSSHNRMLVQMSRALGALLRTSFEISTTRKNGPASSLPLHRAVLDAVIARNPARAEKAVLVLIDGARQDIETVLASRRKIPRISRPATQLKAFAL
jgi:DNA-binding FadR family transcriptional regulator